MDITVGRKAIADATEKLKNWGRWGKDDQIGTLNHILPEDIVRAAGLIRTGKVLALGIPLDPNGPRRPDCSAAAGIRSTPCSPPARMRSPAATIRCRASATPTTPSTCRCRLPRTGTRSDISSTRKQCTTASMRARPIATASASSASSTPRTRWSGAVCCSTWRAFAASPGSRTARPFQRRTR